MGAHISIPMYQRAVKQRYRLVGLKCLKCGKINFPPKAGCKYCGNFDQFEEAQLSGKGKVYSYTIIAGAGAPPEFSEEAAYRRFYPVVLVELDEGPRIVAQLVDVEKDQVEIGMPVELVIRRIYTEEDVIRYGYKFRPQKINS
ncbi:Zn-ribbon domain-containing OB-fold protein [Desulfofundulus sp. TPOSR]|uniref:Zn-ribbon domain-containing OB-fold protein n=1 Tax=Desulfofundulus sp. TPOSR TaxID=2714340 RepID=UPI0014092F80|nr:Zn-ribbon domain-containing OB-fold protein [Desulfofundulus sp. TPOSR]NHM26382.1 Zn-ribbon domain-containing OB-fold protein [Desulfofundulus sp. TPOSR]